MKVTVVHNLRSGGARRRLAEQMSGLDADVREICLKGAEAVRSDAVIVGLDEKAPMAHPLLRPPLRYRDQAALESAWARVTQLVTAQDTDVAFVNPCRLQQTPLCLTRLRVPSLYFCDEPRRVDHEPAGIASRRSLTRPLYEPLYWRQRRRDIDAARRATRVATNSNYTAGAIERAYGRSARVIPSGVSATLRAPVGRRADFLMSVGTLIPSKGHDLAVLAASAAARRRPVVIVGPRPAPEEEARLRALAERGGVALTIRTGIADTELTSLYATAHALLYLARREPFGLASLEAQAAGCPVVVSAEGGLPETISEGETGWSVPRDPRAAAVRLDELEDPARHARMSAAARRRAEPLSWAASAAAVQALLRETASRSRWEGHHLA